MDNVNPIFQVWIQSPNRFNLPLLPLGDTYYNLRCTTTLGTILDQNILLLPPFASNGRARGVYDSKHVTTSSTSDVGPEQSPSRRAFSDIIALIFSTAWRWLPACAIACLPHRRGPPRDREHDAGINKVGVFTVDQESWAPALLQKKPVTLIRTKGRKLRQTRPCQSNP